MKIMQKILNFIKYSKFNYFSPKEIEYGKLNKKEKSARIKYHYYESRPVYKHFGEWPVIVFLY